MVKNEFMRSILKELEKFLVLKSNFKMLGNNYELILFVPSEDFGSNLNYSLIISAESLNNFQQRDLILELFGHFQKNLSSYDYNAISRLNILNSMDSFVKNTSLIAAYVNEEIEISNLQIGGVEIDRGFIIKSKLLGNLIENRDISMDFINNEGFFETSLLRLKKINEDFTLIGYTQRGINEFLNEEFASAVKDEELMLKKQFIAKISMDKILNVY